MSVSTLLDQLNHTRTTNGNPAFLSTLLPNLDFFSRSGNITYPNLLADFERSIKEDEEIALRNLLHMRDVRAGKGVRNNARIILGWLVDNHADLITKSNLLQQIVEVGRWDDIFHLVGKNNPIVTSQIIKIVAAELIKPEPNALLLKWLPINSKQELDKKFLFLLRNYLKVDAKTLRKSVTSRRKTFIPEFKFCTNQWSLLEYSKLPSQCFRKHRKAFQRNDEERFTTFVERAVAGEVKLNASTLYPHEVLGSTRYGNNVTGAQQAMWNNLPNFLGEGLSILPVVDVSSSMGCTAYGNYSCMDIAISLGLYLAERNTSIFKDRFLTFESTPNFVSLENCRSLQERITTTLRSPWGGSTNLQGVFTALLREAIRNKVPQENMPQNILIISDGQFNSQVRGDSETALQSIKREYEEAGYTAPVIVFWNVASSHQNVQAEYRDDGVVLLSGYSASILKAIFDNTLEQYTPLNAMLATLLDERYNVILKD